MINSDSKWNNSCLKSERQAASWLLVAGKVCCIGCAIQNRLMFSIEDDDNHQLSNVLCTEHWNNWYALHYHQPSVECPQISEKAWKASLPRISAEHMKQAWKLQPCYSVTHKPWPVGLRGSCIFSILFVKKLNLHPSLHVRDQVSHPCKTGDKVSLYILIIIFLYGKWEDKIFWTQWEKVFPRLVLLLISWHIQVRFKKP